MNFLGHLDLEQQQHLARNVFLAFKQGGLVHKTPDECQRDADFYHHVYHAAIYAFSSGVIAKPVFYYREKCIENGWLYDLQKIGQASQITQNYQLRKHFPDNNAFADGVAIGALITFLKLRATLTEIILPYDAEHLQPKLNSLQEDIGDLVIAQRILEGLRAGMKKIAFEATLKGTRCALATPDDAGLRISPALDQMIGAIADRDGDVISKYQDFLFGTSPVIARKNMKHAFGTTAWLREGQKQIPADKPYTDLIASLFSETIARVEVRIALCELASPANINKAPLP